MKSPRSYCTLHRSNRPQGVDRLNQDFYFGPGGEPPYTSSTLPSQPDLRRCPNSDSRLSSILNSAIGGSMLQIRTLSNSAVKDAGWERCWMGTPSRALTVLQPYSRDGTLSPSLCLRLMSTTSLCDRNSWSSFVNQIERRFRCAAEASEPCRIHNLAHSFLSGLGA